MEFSKIAIAVVTMVAPYAPFLVELGKLSARKLAEVIAERGGDAAWEKVCTLWNRINTYFKQDAQVQEAIAEIATDSTNEDLQLQLVKLLAVRLKESPDFSNELNDILGGDKIVQTLVATKNSWVENIAQDIVGSGGYQEVRANDRSIIIGVKQNIRKKN